MREREKGKRISEYYSVKDISIELCGTQQCFEVKILYHRMEDLTLPFTISPLSTKVLFLWKTVEANCLLGLKKSIE